MRALPSRLPAATRAAAARRLASPAAAAQAADQAAQPTAAAAAAPPDLARWAPRGGPWDSPPSRWVVFSDLHLSPRTQTLSLEVLRRVHAEAEARSAGVLFLGDFWHMRGALPVVPLNAAVRLFSEEWARPTLMLVGNHDQASAGGMAHALTPLAAASPLVHVFDAPALYGGALWLPYRRDAEELRAAIRAAAALGALGAGGTGGVGAVFAHADVVGASLNDAFQARDGLPPTLFPPGVPTYTGHYHAPHTVPGTRIRYVGSPYQGDRRLTAGFRAFGGRGRVLGC
jgi:hypothetical protein